jgi:hypothetical protein
MKIWYSTQCCSSHCSTLSNARHNSRAPCGRMATRSKRTEQSGSVATATWPAVVSGPRCVRCRLGRVSSLPPTTLSISRDTRTPRASASHPHRTQALRTRIAPTLLIISNSSCFWSRPKQQATPRSPDTKCQLLKMPVRFKGQRLAACSLTDAFRCVR